MRINRTIILFVALIIVLAVVLNIEYYYLQIDTDITTKFIIIFLFNFSVISLLTLVFFVSKNFIKLWIERRQRIIGYKFRTKLVIIFVVLTLVPSSMLFIVASEIVANYIDRWFDPQIERPLKDALDLSREFYDIERERTINKARKVIRGEVFRDNITVSILPALPDNPSETIRNAFEGQEGTEVISRDDRDIIRAVIPEVIKGSVNRVFVAESVVPSGIVTRIEGVKEAQKKYATMKKLQLPLKFNYLLVLAFFTSLIVFMAMWASLKISRGITEPIGTLAEATEEIAAGDLNVNIDIERDDEIGTLVVSFNRMVRELKESKASLEAAYFEADRRRVSIESIVENVESGVVSIETDGTIQTINGSACRILGIDPEAVQAGNDHYAVLLSNIDSHELKDFITAIDLRDVKTVKEQVAVTMKGKKLILRVFITRLTLPDNMPIGILVVFDDLTDIIRAQQALTWQDVARRIAHEIKNPLTPIKLSAERILKKWEKKGNDLDDTIQTSTNTIIREVEDLRKLANEFTRFGKMPEIKKEVVDIREMLKDVSNLYREYDHVIMQLNIPEDIPLIHIDAEQFKRVLINLFDNAINAMDGEGDISVSAFLNGKDSTMVLEIADTGCGIEKADMDKLFVPYFSTKQEGTGLGLAISHMIISKHGGTISVSNNEPKGARFAITIPV